MSDHARIIPRNADWIDGDLYMHVNTDAFTVRQGSRQRGMPCIICTYPVGNQPVHILSIVAGIICPTDGKHLNACGLFCHAHCMPHSAHALARAVAEAIDRLDH